MKSKILFFLLFAFVTIVITYGQKNNKKVTITGVVVDVNQNPVTDAIIMIDSKKTSITTDQKGFYKVKVKSSAEKIGIFTFASGITEEAINGRTNINFTFAVSVSQQMNNKANAADEEEVNIGYGTIKRKNLTSSVGQIDGTKQRYSSYRTIYDMLRGEVPGVQVNGNSIKIQGASSLTLSTEPLFVVDGMIVGSVDGIQPHMVKSIEVLKGSAASIYGSRGGNGVILITLISSKDNK
jgi:TonB-dependent SusC/RagA subfamily outer membrane receptor